jgi:hypothetical protein
MTDSYRCDGPTSSQRAREAKLIRELRAKHSYLIYELSHEADRYATISRWKRDSKRMTLKPASCIKLVVPTNSALGREIEAMRRANNRKAKREAKRKEAKREARRIAMEHKKAEQAKQLERALRRKKTS